MTAFRYFEDFVPGEEIDLGCYELGRDEIIDFATDFDPQPFHLDEEAGKASLLGTFCASGWQACGVTMRLMVDALLANTASMGAGSIDRVRWLKPVVPGPLFARLLVLDARASRSRPEMGIVQCRATLMDASGTALLEMEFPMLQGRRAAP